VASKLLFELGPRYERVDKARDASFDIQVISLQSGATVELMRTPPDPPHETSPQVQEPLLQPCGWAHRD
jgi:hypothetical protein